ncbi:DoxX family protein [Mucilaginibacter sp. RB4R14]|uniref:DoxX family protein n=1 Tax=Mucilaginibacter aurantiaciroseus TaxID=2949308 RepID=UPI0020907068|nr:DoxX family protein [Mucilaginibacter aurantiaciroseus]MCO5935904.1 DoxX family protein [Mucilaginibacter aurantiaciroseus]
MNTLANCAQVIIALSIGYVWIIRFDNIVVEFKQYGIPDVLRSFVGASKIALSTLLVAGIWYPSLVLIPALLMAALMICAQIAHFRVKNPWYKFMPSALLLTLSLFTAWVHSGLLKI